MIKAFIAAFVVFFAMLGSNAFMYKFGYDAGVHGYHNQCFTAGPGYIIDDETGTIVSCGPLTIVPKEERQMYKEST